MKNGDSSSARVNDGPTSLTSFRMIAGPLAPERCIGDALVNNFAEAPKPHLPPMEVRVLSSATGGVLPAGTASTAMRTIFPLPPLSWIIYETKVMCKYSSATDGKMNFNQLAPPCWRKVIQTKSRQTLLFDSGGCSSHLRDRLFLRGRRTLLRGGSVWTLRRYLRLERFC